MWNFFYMAPIDRPQPPQGAIWSFSIQPRQTITIMLGVSINGVADEDFRRQLRLTCHA